jgi:O-methyltransferase
MLLNRDRVVEAVRWRTEALIERLPRGVRTWIFNQRLARQVKQGQTSFERARLIHTYRECLQMLLRHEPAAALGDYLEFGVFHGSTLSCMHEARQSLGLQQMRLFGFDSFEGLPESAAGEDDGLWAPGQFKSSLQLTRDNLARWGVPADAVTLIKGWFSETAAPATRDRYAIKRASIIMLDCDLYSSTVEALAFCEPLMDARTVLVFDDWNAGGLAARNLGQRRAFDEFLARHSEFTAEAIPGLNYKDKADPVLFMVTRAAGLARRSQEFAAD